MMKNFNIIKKKGLPPPKNVRFQGGGVNFFWEEPLNIFFRYKILNRTSYGVS